MNLPTVIATNEISVYAFDYTLQTVFILPGLEFADCVSCKDVTTHSKKKLNCSSPEDLGSVKYLFFTEEVSVA